jgi:hypothetical protein
VAEFWAYVHALLPHACQTKDLSDFSGFVPGEDRQILPDKVVVSAREIAARYVWGDSKVAHKDDFSTLPLVKRAEEVLSSRRRSGTSLVIHGNSMVSQKQTVSNDYGNFEKVRSRSVRTGKTLLASTVMKEVLRMRLQPGHLADSYEWVQFHTLKGRVVSGDSEAQSEYQTCDWLVVDGIDLLNNASDAAKQYQIDLFDRVFLERVEQGLPTILVFKIDINEIDGIEEELGNGIAQIVSDPSTFKIGLGRPIL